MVTHEADIARYAERNVVMRDGEIFSDTTVGDRLDAASELKQLKTQQRSRRRKEAELIQ